MNSILAIAALGFLIVVHEGGHLIVARLCGMRVDRFSIGFGPGLLKHKSKKGTIYQLAPIPFGGFVEVAGMNIAEEVDPADREAYPNRPAWQRFATIFAGPATNFLSAIVLAFLLYSCHGMAGTTWHVGDLKPGYDAQTKLLAGDRILAVDGSALYAPSSTALSAAVNATKSPTVHLRVLRGGVGVVELDVRKKLDVDPKGAPVFRIGVINEVDVERVGPIGAAGAAIRYPVKQTKVILAGLRDIVLGLEDARPTGPVGIYEEFRKAFTANWIYGVELMMLLSVYLGLVNLFPLPALDGGRLVFLMYEMVTRRRANPKIETMVHMGGIMVLGVVMILVTLNDCHVL